MPSIRFAAAPYTIGSHTLLQVPKPASSKLPSRGLVMVGGTINGFGFVAPLEPDGMGSHWLEIDAKMQKAGVEVGDEAKLEIEPVEAWPEPSVPADIKKALVGDAKASVTWKATTPAARWDWIRWIRATNNPDTRAKRIVVACSKLRSGMKRPCCFNRAMCTEPAVSKSGVLMERE